MSAAVSIYIYHHTPSDQSRLYRVTQLRTDGVYCRESVVSKHNHCCTAVHTVGPVSPPDLCLYKRKEFIVHGTISYVVFQNIPVVTTAVLYIHFPPQGTYACTSVKSEMNTVQYHPLCPNIVTAVLLLYILWTGFPPFPTYACQRVKSLVYTVQYHMLVSKHSYYCCTVDPFSPSRLLSVQYSNLFTGTIMEK